MDSSFITSKIPKVLSRMNNMEAVHMHKSTMGIILLMICFFPLTLQAGQVQEIVAAQDALVKSVTGEQIPLTKAINEIEEKYDVNILVKTSQVRNQSVAKRQTISDDLATELEQLLEPIGMIYEQVSASNYIIYDKPPPVFPEVIQETITGTVTDGQSGETLPGVNILVKGTSTGASTDVDGNYELHVESLQDTLMVSFVGYQTQEVPINGRTEIDVALEPQAIAGEEMVVTGMTQQKQRLIASSLSTIDVSSNIESQPITQLSQALQGGVTGITVNQGSGLPGGNSATIKIRGIGTLGNTNPLILVDGVPTDLNDVNPVNVKDITVLKDAAASAQYGSRGANGVILVTTKRGQSGKMHASYSAYGGFQAPTYLPNIVGSPTYMQMLNEARTNIGSSQLYSQAEIEKARDGSDPINYADEDWVNNILQPSASIMNHSLTVSGGTRKTRFNVTASYLDEGGLMENTGYNRFMLRANTGATLRENITMKLDLSLKRGNQRQPYSCRVCAGGGGAQYILSMTYKIPPTLVDKYSPENNQPTYYSNYRNNMRNPRALLDHGGRINRETDKINLNFRPQWDIKSNLSLNLQYNLQMSSSREIRHRSSHNFLNFQTGNVDHSFSNGNSSSLTGKSTYNFLQADLNYKLDVGKHNATLVAGVSQQYESPNAIDINTLRSTFGRLNYAYNETYLLSSSIRYDGSSRFGAGNKWGYFPSVALGWNVSNEKFMSSLGFLNNWKLRASYGMLGNNKNVGYYSYESTINSGNGVENTLGNPNITWETTKTLNFGTNISFLEYGDIQLTVDWYNKITDNILLYPPMPEASGRGNTPINAGKVRNRGWEFEVNINHNFTRQLNIFGKLGFSTYKNRILELPGGPYYSENKIQKQGEAIGMYYGYKTDGLLQPSDIQNDVAQFQNQEAGDIKYIDANNDGAINSDDQTIIGNPNPRNNYFLSFGVKYKGFDFETMVNGYSKNTAVLSEDLAAPLHVSAPGSVPLKMQTDYWTQNNKDARFPRLVPDGLNSANVSTFSDFWFENAAYLRVKFIQLGYSLNSELIGKLNLSKVRFYINLKDPFTFSSYNYLDPQSQGTIDTYPLLRSYTFGIKVDI